MSTQGTPGAWWERGLEAQAANDAAQAVAAFTQAWETSATPRDRAISAHYLAHSSTTAEDQLRWARISVEQAAEAEFDEVVEMLVSLYVTLADAYRESGELDRARDYYMHGSEVAEAIEEAGGSIDEVTWGAISSGLGACGFVAQGLSEDVFTLIDSLVESGSFGALSVVLPAVLRCTGTDAQVQRLAAALDTAYWTPGLIGGSDRMLVLAAAAAARAQIQTSVEQGAGVSAEAAEQSGGSVVAGLAASPAQQVTDGESDAPDVPFRL
ncbi:hypothetical protein AAFP30_22160 [Gordonia sp. CPCC 205515]|uniref:hypothetical protein n=1 Tax=Gordonia sp. CPCC 205515 TaxID=3140791 RepID=UPI003AF347BA